MLFVAIGFIILFISFFIALVTLIREQSQRGELEDSRLSEESLSLATETVEAEPEVQVERQNIGLGVQAIDQEGQLPVNNADPLDEYVPFPWETTQFDSGQEPQGNLEPGVYQVDDKQRIDFGAIDDGLNGEVSLADLRGQQSEK